MVFSRPIKIAVLALATVCASYFAAADGDDHVSQNKSPSNILPEPLYPPDQRHLIPDVLNVPFRRYGQTLTETGSLPAHVFTQFDFRAIGESIVERVHRLKEHTSALGPDDKPSYDYLRDSEIQIYFPQRLIPKILTSGIRNQHTTGMPMASGGGATISHKQSTEEGIGMMKFDNPRVSGPKNPFNFIRPISANFDLTAERNLGNSQDPPLLPDPLEYRNGATRYGDVLT